MTTLQVESQPMILEVKGKVMSSAMELVVPRLNCGRFIEHCKPSILQRIQPSSMLHFSRDIRVHSLRILLGGPRLSSAPMGFE